MPRAVLEIVRATLLAHDQLFRQKPDATKLLGASTDVKLTAAMRMLYEGWSDYSLVESLRISEPLVMDGMAHLFKETYTVLNRIGFTVRRLSIWKRMIIDTVIWDYQVV